MPESPMALEQERRILRGEAGRLGRELPVPVARAAGVSEAPFLGTARYRRPVGGVPRDEILCWKEEKAGKRPCQFWVLFKNKKKQGVWKPIVKMTRWKPSKEEQRNMEKKEILGTISCRPLLGPGAGARPAEERSRGPVAH